MNAYYTPDFQVPILKEALKNISNVNIHKNITDIKSINVAISKSLNTSALSDAIKNANANDILREQFKKYDVSSTLRKAISESLDSITFKIPARPNSNTPFTNEEVIQVPRPKVEGYTEIDNSTGEVIKVSTPKIISTHRTIETADGVKQETYTEYSKPEYIPPEPVSLESSNVNKNPFNLTLGDRRFNKFIFNINETAFKVELQYSLPYFFDGQISYAVIVMLFSIHCLVAIMSKNFDKDKYDEKL